MAVPGRSRRSAISRNKAPCMCPLPPPSRHQHFDEMMTSTRHSAAADVPALALRLKRRARFYESLDNLRMALV